MQTRDAERQVIAWSLAIITVLVATVVWRTDGAFGYSLDDPYIHLALAKNIWLGHYGINSGEMAAPSSSIIWPLLLAPFAGTSFGQFAPLLINAACLVGTAVLLLRFLVIHMSPRPAVLLTLASVFSLNLFGVVFTGMEHNLQVLLVAIIAVTLGGVSLPRYWLFIALCLLPMVRYEGLAISVPVLIWRATAGEAKSAAIAAAALIAGIIGFSEFLYVNDLGALPSSVLAKQQTLSLDGFGRIRSLLMTLRDNLSAMRTYAVLVALVFFAGFFRKGLSPLIVILTVSSTLVFTLGHNGWFGRYELYFLLFCLIIAAAIGFPLLNKSRMDRAAPVIAMVLLVVNIELWPVTFATPEAARNIRFQQHQLGVIASQFLKEPIAVNDLGWVAYTSQDYVLDLVGLASREALLAQQSDKSGAWVEEIMERKHVEFAFVYPGWFPNRPHNWIRVGDLVYRGPRVTISEDRVGLFATSPAAAQRLKVALDAFQKSAEDSPSKIEFAEGY